MIALLMSLKQLSAALRTATAFIVVCVAIGSLTAQQFDESPVIQHIDAAVKARFDGIESFTVIERYAVFRGNNQTDPVAEMTVKTLYRRDSGKSYTILSESGPEIVKKIAFGQLLDNEKRINQPGNREASWFTSANYEMKLKPGGTQQLNGRNCLALAITPRRKATNLIDGTIWVDARDYSIVQIQGVSSRSPSLFSAPPQMMRKYANVSGFAEATHAQAVSNSFLFGKTIVTIDYSNYQIRLRAAR
jgi:outer membrane lipoprotein-sorting protein